MPRREPADSVAILQEVRSSLDPFALLRESLGDEFKCDHQNVFFRCVEDSNEAIMITNKSGTMVFVNPAWCRIYGFTHSEALGKTPRLLHSGIQTEAFYKDMWAKIHNPKIAHWKGELVNRAKNGTLVPVLLTITPIRSEKSGEALGYMGLAIDMTAKKDLEAKVAHQDRLASIGLLASGLAHEIGTPLGVVRGRAEYLMMQAESPVFRKSLGIITSEIDRISKLIRSLLRVSRGFSDVQMECISPADAASDVLGLVGQNLKEDRVEVYQKIPSGLRVMGDFNRLEQVFLNLVMNSIHAIRKAKADGRSENHFLSLEAHSEKDKTTISVVDSGCGIPPENMNKLFKPFFTTKDIGEGTGLGLAIVGQLVREMNGQVSVQSTVNGGTTFSITFNSV